MAAPAVAAATSALAVAVVAAAVARSEVAPVVVVRAAPAALGAPEAEAADRVLPV